MTRRLLVAAVFAGIAAITSTRAAVSPPATNAAPAPAARPSQLSDRDLIRLYQAAAVTRPHRVHPHRRPGDPTAAQLRRLAWCESGRDNSATVNSTGRARGRYQFLTSTWRSVGGRGDPAAASYAEQTHRAVLLYRREGWTPWLASSACTGLR